MSEIETHNGERGAALLATDADQLAAQEILASYGAMTDLAERTKDGIKRSLEAAIRCGTLLGVQREKVGHGQWNSWLDTYCHEIKIHTAQRYIRLANAYATHESLLKNAKSKRQGLIAIGMLADPAQGVRKRLDKQSKPLKPAGGESGYLAIFHEFFAEKAIEELVQTADFGAWNERELETAIRTLEPITLVRNRMAHSLSQKLRGETLPEPMF